MAPSSGKRACEEWKGIPSTSWRPTLRSSGSGRKAWRTCCRTNSRGSRRWGGRLPRRSPSRASPDQRCRGRCPPSALRLCVSRRPPFFVSLHHQKKEADVSVADRIVAGSLLALAACGTVGAYRAIFPAQPPPVVIQSPPPVAPTAAPSPAPAQAAPAPQPIVIIIKEAAAPPPAVTETAPRQAVRAEIRRPTPRPPRRPDPDRNHDRGLAEVYAAARLQMNAGR